MKSRVVAIERAAAAVTFVLQTLKIKQLRDQSVVLLSICRRQFVVHYFISFIEQLPVVNVGFGVEKVEDVVVLGHGLD